VIAARVAAVRDRIARAAARAGRLPGDVTLVAVSKTFPAAAVREAFEAGIRDFGENKVQEGEAKIAALGDLSSRGLRWHLVGHLQSNKARKAGALFDWIHALDGVDLGRRLNAVGTERSKPVRVLVQVDLAGETTKFGVPESELFPTLEALKGLESLEVGGLMILPPYNEDPEKSRPYFRRLRELSEKGLSAGLLRGYLSMGMSQDFEVAVEEGATLVRVGTALFGERTPKT
jgi:pyridoxal phosphate enzyme (YggS family)